MRLFALFSFAVLLSLTGALSAPYDTPSGEPFSLVMDHAQRECNDPPEYYAIDLVPTRNLPGLGRAGGKGYVTYGESPFGISVTHSGRYLYDLLIAAERLPERADGRYVAWVTSPELDQIERIGSLDGELRATANVSFNKFLVVVTFEPPGAEGATWQGPIILRGMSRSGLMHTMAGHGPYSSEPCAKFGY